ncbi:MAG: M48 family metalloprotease [Pseudohongiellaceae bacterium]|nr:M48 family metalloprotease [Pseudohongiellaceae bacterium]
MFNIKRIIGALCTTVLCSSLQAQVQLPSLGDRISGLISLDDEYALGKEFLRSVRRSSETINDPLLYSYLVNATHQLALHSELQDFRLSFIIIDSPELNAFAAPGGIIGVNGGLFLNAQTEGEFMSVMAHELAHVSQRHFARSVEDAQRRRIPELATLLASIIIMGAGDGESGQAAIMAAQGLAIENQLRFSRSNEAEADRVGLRTLYAAGYDPQQMPNMFERLVDLNRYGTKVPEFLLSHPVTESRIADTRGRAGRYPARQATGSLDYQLMRARVLVKYQRDAQANILDFQRNMETANNEAQRKGAKYGLSLAYAQNGDYAKALNELEELQKDDPNRIAYIVTQAEILVQQNEAASAITLLERHLRISPGNHPLSMAYADALEANRQYLDAARVLERQAAARPDDHELWYQIAETQGLVGNVSKVHQARAEYFILVGDFRRAAEQIEYALAIETHRTDNGPVLAKLRQRARDVQQLERTARTGP